MVEIDLDEEIDFQKKVGGKIEDIQLIKDVMVDKT